MSVVAAYAEITRRLALLDMAPQPDAPAWWGSGTTLQWSLVIAPPDPEWGEVPAGALAVTGRCCLLPEYQPPARHASHRYMWTPSDDCDLPTVAFRSACYALDGWHREFDPLYTVPGAPPTLIASNRIVGASCRYADRVSSPAPQLTVVPVWPQRAMLDDQGQVVYADDDTEETMRVVRVTLQHAMDARVSPETLRDALLEQVERLNALLGRRR